MPRFRSSSVQPTARLDHSTHCPSTMADSCSSGNAYGAVAGSSSEEATARSDYCSNRRHCHQRTGHYCFSCAALDAFWSSADTAIAAADYSSLATAATFGAASRQFAGCC